MIKRVLVACEFSGIVRDAFRQRGANAWSCDLLPSERVGPHFQRDVLTLLNAGWDLMVAHPPCTYLSVTGNRWFKVQPDREGKREDAVNFFMALMNAPIPHIAVENPVGFMSTRFRKPNQIIQPWMFGHGECKKTCLWLKGLPELKPTAVVEGRSQRVWLEPPGVNRWKNRSRTYEGIASAMADQWLAYINMDSE